MVPNAKIAKLFLFYEKPKERFRQFEVFYKHLSIDEATSMVPYIGHHLAKTFIKNKPISFDYKIWTLCGKDGNTYNVDIYSGKTGDTATLVGSRVMNKMLEVIENTSIHIVYFDNFFTSHSLP